MSRELKRVPMDFDHPIKTTWPGYLDPSGNYGEDWSPTGPPSGEGFQMWETTSEGSPISPVFASPDELATWLADTNASAFGRLGATKEQWLAMIGKGWAPSAVMDNKGLRSGVEASCE